MVTFTLVPDKGIIPDKGIMLPWLSLPWYQIKVLCYQGHLNSDPVFYPHNRFILHTIGNCGECNYSQYVYGFYRRIYVYIYVLDMEFPEYQLTFSAS